MWLLPHETVIPYYYYIQNIHSHWEHATCKVALDAKS